LFPPAEEVAMIGDYPTEGWRLWAFVAGLVLVGLVGEMLMLVVGGDSWVPLVLFRSGSAGLASETGGVDRCIVV
jgi:hypothetical protein